MPWVTRFNYYASAKMKQYESLERNLSDKRNKIADNQIDVKKFKRSLLYKVDNLGDLSGDYLVKYENKRDEYFTNYSRLEKIFDDFLKDLNHAIAQCISKKLEWNKQIYTREWEEPEEDLRE